MEGKSLEVLVDYEITKCRIFSSSYNGFLPRQLPRHLTSTVCPLTDHSTNGVAITDFCEISHVSVAYFVCVCVFFFYILTEVIHLSKPFFSYPLCILNICQSTSGFTFSGLPRSSSALYFARFIARFIPRFIPVTYLCSVLFFYSFTGTTSRFFTLN